MAKPSVCAVMLVNGREAMVRRAIRSFEAQTYENKNLLIFETSAAPQSRDGDIDDIVRYWMPSSAHRSIGYLRNDANAAVRSDIICHFDSDDISHPNRIAEQVALLESSGKECVGYRDLLFWNETPGHFCGAWLYSNNDPRYCLGTSLCYWRSVWERRPFEDAPKRSGATGEDTLWIAGVDSMGCKMRYWVGSTAGDDNPRMIASIHGNNTQDYRYLETSPSWRRAPEWDEYCRERMQL